MKKKFFIACTALVMSAAAMVGVKAYNYYSMPELMRANLEALSNGEKKNTLSLKCSRSNLKTCLARCLHCNVVWLGKPYANGAFVDNYGDGKWIEMGGVCPECGGQMDHLVNDL